MKNLISAFDYGFEKLHRRNSEFVESLPTEMIYRQPRQTKDALPIYSCGEYVLRSAAAVEQTFGGITTKLWDDPFEWTLPEALFDNAKILEYLDEVEATRRKGFALFTADDVLQKEILAPARLKTIFALLLETICRAENLQGRAFATFKFFSDAALPR